MKGIWEIFICPWFVLVNSRKYSFVLPHEAIIFGDTSPKVTFLAGYMMRYAGKDHLLFIPANMGVHWVLVAINLRTKSLYYLDPAPEGMISNRPQLKKFVELQIASIVDTLLDCT